MSDLFLRPLFTWRSAVASEHGPKSPITRHVLLTLSLHMNEKGESCFPSIDTLTAETGLARRSVLEHLKVAAEDGWLGKRELKTPDKGKGWRRVEYFSVIPEAVETALLEKRSARRAPPKRGAANAPATEDGGASDVDGGASDSIIVVQEVHPNTSVNSPKSKNPMGDVPSPGFETAWQNYPKRAGNNPKRDAWKAWKTRVKEGVAEDAMAAAVIRYRAFCVVTLKMGTEKVLQAKTFFGPARPFEQDFDLPLDPAPKKAVVPTEWWTSTEGLQAKAEEVGLKPNEGEESIYFRCRLFAHLGDGPWINSRNATEMRLIEYFRERMPGERASA